MKSTFKAGTLAALLALGAASAQADETIGTYGYIGAGVGVGTLEAEPLDSRFDESDTAWRLYGGYMFNENIGAEFGLTDYGSPDNSEVSADDMTTFTGQVIGVLPLGNFDLFAKIGLAYYDAEFEDVTNASWSRDGIEFAGGFGARYNFGRIALRAEIETIDIDFGDLYNFSAGAQYRF